MEYITILVGLIVITSNVLAINTIDLNINHAGLFALKLDTTLPVYSNLSEGCQKELENNELPELLELCSLNNTIDALEDSCETVFSNSCTNFFENFISYFPSCKNDKSIIDLGTSLKTSQVRSKYFCTLNGDGEICPNAIQLMTTGELIYNNTIQDCVYQSCINNHIAMLEDAKEYGQLRNSLYISEYEINQEIFTQFEEKFIAYLKSSECSAMTKDDTNNAKFIFKSGSNLRVSTVKKFTSTILLSLFLLYVIF